MAKKAAKRSANANPGALGFITIPAAPGKPRKTRWTVVSDRTIPLGFQKDFLDMAGDVLDRAKLSDHTGLIGRFPAAYIRRKNALYRKYKVPTYPGGVPFELAYLERKVKPFFEAALGLGFAGIEISADTIPPIPRQERTALIKTAKRLGLEVHTEVGEKLSDTAIQVDDAVASIQADLEAGAHKVAIENNDLVRLFKHEPRAIVDIVKRVGLEHVSFEIGPAGWPEMPGWLITEFGPDVNVQNITPEQIVPFEAIRRGLNRLTGYTYLMNHPNR